MAQQFTDQNFQQDVLDLKDKLVVVDFYADWCGPCRMLTPIIEELAKEMGDKIKIGKVDVDANQETAIKYGVQSIPTILLIKNGEVVEKLIGFQNKDRLEETIENHF
jgi:thioredoxin 1